MGQGEIIELLEKLRRPLSRTEIAQLLEQDVTNISHHLKKLITHHEIKIVELNREQAAGFFGINAPSRRMRLYYV
jgi:predicted transcriptional regulator